MYRRRGSQLDLIFKLVNSESGLVSYRYHAQSYGDRSNKDTYVWNIFVECHVRIAKRVFHFRGVGLVRWVSRVGRVSVFSMKGFGSLRWGCGGSLADLGQHLE